MMDTIEYVGTGTIMIKRSRRVRQLAGEPANPPAEPLDAAERGPRTT